MIDIDVLLADGLCVVPWYVVSRAGDYLDLTRRYGRVRYFVAAGPDDLGVRPVIALVMATQSRSGAFALVRRQGRVRALCPCGRRMKHIWPVGREGLGCRRCHQQAKRDRILRN